MNDVVATCGTTFFLSHKRENREQIDCQYFTSIDTREVRIGMGTDREQYIFLFQNL